MLQEKLSQVKEFWKQQNLSLIKPLSENELINSFIRLKTSISKDVKEIYLYLNGFDDREMDSECLTFWDVEKIIRENKQNTEYVCFADFLIDSQRYAFKFEHADISSIYVDFGESDKRQVANSFEEFFELYLRNPSKLFI